jgi:3-mercaptopyruvate sulfurtransferase SseA
MDDSERDYGKRFFELSYKEAIKQGLISDYKILTVTVGDGRIRQLITDNRILDLNLRDLDEVEAQSAAAGIALKRVLKEHGIKHAISFHRSIRAADRFREQQDALNGLRDIGPRTTNFHVSSKKTAGQRADSLREFVRSKRSLITNARCLTEGVDVPETDCVLFADPKQSTIDIVQAAGRALRQFRGKDYGYILLPIIVPPKMDFEKFAETTAFRQVVRTIGALSTQDGRIADEFRAIEQGHISSGKIVEIEGDVPVGMKIKLGDFAKAISTQIWKVVGRANWRNFEDARTFARSRGFKSVSEWNDYCASGQRPADIPSAPQVIYANTGWAGWGDWLGNGTVANQLRQYLPFLKARSFVHRLGLKSRGEWDKYCASGKKPPDIPANPPRVYAKDGWSGWGDWLGTGRRRGSGWWPFKEARAFARSRGFKSRDEWHAYCRSGKKPADIPPYPDRVYKKTGWAGWGDWLGTDQVATHLRRYRPFLKARRFVRGLRLQSGKEWKTYCQSGKKPADIPTKPERVYAKSGWAGMSDWLGNGRHARGSPWRPFKTARAYVRKLGFKSQHEWFDYCKSGKKPLDIPSAPQVIYANTGWAGWGDWLGTGTVANRLRKYLPFTEARAFVHSLGLKTRDEWVAYCRSGKKPADIPTNPNQTYAKTGWAGMGDWLGTGRHARGSPWRPFKAARAYVRKLGFKSQHDWFDYCRSSKKPPDIPSNPQLAYSGKGWAGWGDWLGTGRRHGSRWLGTRARPRR